MPDQDKFRPQHLALAIALALGCVEFSSAQELSANTEAPAPVDARLLPRVESSRDPLAVLQSFSTADRTTKQEVDSADSVIKGTDANDLIIVKNGGSVKGRAQGGGGINAIHLNATEGGVLGDTQNFDSLYASAGAWTLNSKSDFTDGVMVLADGNLTNAGKVMGRAIAAGRLVNSGEIRGHVDVEQSGTFGGSGTVGSLTVHGRVDVNKILGAPKIKGNLSLTETSVLAYEVNPEGSGETIKVGGTASLGGSTLKLVSIPGEYPQSSRYTIIEAKDKVEGQFGEVLNDLAFMDPKVRYNKKSVGLTYERNPVPVAALATSTNGVKFAEGIGDSAADPTDEARAEFLSPALNADLSANAPKPIVDINPSISASNPTFVGESSTTQPNPEGVIDPLLDALGATPVAGSTSDPNTDINSSFGAVSPTLAGDSSDKVPNPADMMDSSSTVMVAGHAAEQSSAAEGGIPAAGLPANAPNPPSLTAPFSVVADGTSAADLPNGTQSPAATTDTSVVTVSSPVATHSSINTLNRTAANDSTNATVQTTLTTEDAIAAATSPIPQQSTAAAKPATQPAAAPAKPDLPTNAAIAALLGSDKATAAIAIEQLAAGINANLANATLRSIEPVNASMLSAMRQMDRGNFNAQNSAPSLAAGGDADGRVWFQALGNGGTVDRGHVSSALQHSTKGLVLGVDWALDEQWSLGVIGAKSRTRLDGSRLDGDLDSWHLGAYALRQSGPLAIRLGASHGKHAGSTKRQIAFNGFSDRPKGRYDANTQQAFAEFGYNVGNGTISAEPFANIGYQRYHRDSYTEKGGAAKLQVHGQTHDNFSNTFGLRLAQLNTLDNGMQVTPRFSAGWKHTYGDVDSKTRQRLVTGGKTYTVEGAALDRDSLMLDAGLDLAVSPRHTLGVGYNGEIGNDSRSHGVMSQWRMAF